jgi:uncharacterized protein YqgC (DUF456 family)
MGIVSGHFGALSRAGIAMGPFVAAVLLRLIRGRDRLTSSLITFTTGWFAMNVLLAPSFEGTRETLYSLPGRLFH